MPDVIAPPVSSNPTPLPGNTDADVRARFKQISADLKANEVTPPVEVSPEATPPPVVPPVEKKDDIVPSELFDEPTKEVDEYETLLKEEPQGKVTNKHFTNFRQAADKKIQKLAQELEQTKAKIPSDGFIPEPVSKELEALKSKVTEREELIKRKYVEESDEVKGFQRRQEGIGKQLDKLAKALTIDEDNIRQLQRVSLNRRYTLIDEMDISPSAKSDITNLLNQSDQIDGEKEEFLSNWKTHAASLEERAKAEEDAGKAKIKSYYDKAFDEVLGDLSKTSPLFQKKDGQDGWNRQIDADIEDARKAYNAESSTPHKDAESFLAAAATKRMHAMLEKVTSNYRAVKKELDELKAAGTTGGHGGDTKPSDQIKNMTPDERAVWTLRQERAKLNAGS